MSNFKIITIKKYLEEKKNQILLDEKNKKKKSLVEYQKKFNEGNIALEKESKNNQFIFLKLEGDISKFRKNWLINVKDISELTQYNTLAKIGYTNNYIIGISNFKGNICTIIDMSLFLNEKKIYNNSNSCILLKQNSGIALLWPKIEISDAKLIKIDISKYKSSNNFERVNYAKEHYEDNNGNIWNELDVEQLLLSKRIIDGSNINDFA